jgi:hypothetical protein
VSLSRNRMVWDGRGRRSERPRQGCSQVLGKLVHQHRQLGGLRLQGLQQVLVGKFM